MMFTRFVGVLENLESRGNLFLNKDANPVFSERVRNNVYKPLIMFNSKHTSELSGTKMHNQLLRQVRARLKLVTAR